MNCPARIITATALLAICSGCAPAPINRPIKVGDVDTGSNSVEAVRRQRLMAVNSTGDAIPSAVADRVDPASVRVYEFQGPSLWLTINGADGKPTASSSWKKSR